MKGITLREATIEDCDDLYRWRNDPVTRQQSFNDNEISYEEHCNWFKNALKDSNKLLFYIGIGEDNNKSGVVRFDIKNEFFAETHVNVAPEERGKGVGSQLILESCSLFFLKTKRKLILARTKEKNIASIRAFLKAGFSELFRYNDTEWGGIVALVLLTPYGEIRDEGPLYMGNNCPRIKGPLLL